MLKTSAIPGLADPAVDLLKRAGYDTAAALAEAGAERAHAELLRVQKSTGGGDITVDLQEVRAWVAAARHLLAGDIPLAVPLSSRVLRNRNIPIAEVPIGVVTADSQPREPAPRSVSGLPERMPLDRSKLRSVRELKTPAQLLREEAEARRIPANLLQTTRPETNDGIDPGSRRYIRGVLHPHRWRLMLGAFITVLFVILLPISLGAVILLLVSDAAVGGLDWVPRWLLAFPAALLLVGMLYFFLAAGLKCRICAQRLLVPKNCRKNNKAHHVRFLGHILPLALHVLAFRWFRCTFCGSSVRVKE